MRSEPFTPGVSVERRADGALVLRVRELAHVVPGAAPQRREAAVRLDRDAIAALREQLA